MKQRCTIAAAGSSSEPCEQEGCTRTATVRNRRGLVRWFSPLRHLLWLLAIALFLLVVVCDAWLCDDAFISFRTADNFVHGYGLTWNVQERVQVYTHPLWILLFSSVYHFTREPFYTGIFLSMGVSLGAIVYFVWKIARSTAGAVLGVVVLTCSVAFVDFSTSGMENGLTHLILALFLWLFFARVAQEEPETAPDRSVAPLARGETRRESWGGRWFEIEKVPCLLSLLAALAAVNRMDTVLLYLPALVYVWFQRRSWRCLWSMAFGFVPLAAWMGFSLLYYGFAFPNTAYARFHSGIAARALIGQGCYYLWDSLRRDPITLTTVAFALGFACIRRTPRNVCVALGIASYVLYVVWIGGDFMSGRFLTAPLFAAVCLLGSLRWGSAKAWAPAGVVVASLLLLSSRPLGIKGTEFGLPLSDQQSRFFANRGIADECAYYYPGTGLLQVWKAPQNEFPNFKWATAAKRMRAVAEKSSEKTVVCTVYIGIFGFYAGPQVHVVDHFALTDALLARLTAVPDPKWRIAHFKRAIPDGYVESIRSGVNKLKEPGLAEFYEHVRLITQEENLWDWQRLVAIWNMNLGRYEQLLKQEPGAMTLQSASEKSDSKRL